MGRIVYPPHKNPSRWSMEKIRKKDPINILEQGNAVHESIKTVKKIKPSFVLKELNQKENKKIEEYRHYKKTKSILVAFFKEVCYTFQHRSMAHSV